MLFQEIHGDGRFFSATSKQGFTGFNNVFTNHITFNVDAIPDLAVTEISVLERERNDGHGEFLVHAIKHGETDAVDRDGSLLNNIKALRFRMFKPKQHLPGFMLNIDYAGDMIHMTRYEMPAYFF